MSDYLSTTKEIAEDAGCSVATVNNKAKKGGFKLKGRSQEDHARLLEALGNVKSRKHKVKAKSKAPAKTPKRKSVERPDYADVDAYFKHGKKLITEIKKRIGDLDKEKAALTEKLNALLLLHPDSRD